MSAGSPRRLQRHLPQIHHSQTGLGKRLHRERVRSGLEFHSPDGARDKFLKPARLLDGGLDRVEVLIDQYILDQMGHDLLAGHVPGFFRELPDGDRKRMDHFLIIHLAMILTPVINFFANLAILYFTSLSICAGCDLKILFKLTG